MRIFSLLLVAFLLLAGCNPTNPGPDSTAVPSGPGSLTPQSSQTKPPALVETDIADTPGREYIVTLPATETAGTVLPEMLRFNPDQIKQETLCPDDDFVPVQDLGIPSNLGLLITEGDISVHMAKTPYPLKIFQPASELPERSLNLSLNKTMHDVLAPNPDGSLFLYLAFDEGQPSRTLVVESTDGRIRKAVLERDYPFGYATWIDSRHILWSDVPNPQDYWATGESPDDRNYVPVYLIDVKTLEAQELLPIQFPDHRDLYSVQEFIHGEDGNFVFLQHDTPDLVSLEIYSYKTQTIRPVFAWLPVNSLDHPRYTAIQMKSDGTIDSISRDGNSFRIMIQVSIEQLLSGPDALAGHINEFIFSDEIVPYFIPYIFTSTNGFLFTHKNSQEIWSIEDSPEYLHRFDVESQTAYDYCLDVQKWKGRIYVSPDEKFAAMTLYENPMTGEGKKDTVIINLATGARALLTDYQVFGWVTVE